MLPQSKLDGLLNCIDMGQFADSAAPPEAGAARTTELLIGAVPAVPTGGFQNRFSASR